MAKDPEPRDWKIDKYISKCIAINPDKEPPSYEEVGRIIDKWDNMGRHITYPMAGMARIPLSANYFINCPIHY